jgi:hypothetical protein
VGGGKQQLAGSVAVLDFNFVAGQTAGPETHTTKLNYTKQGSSKTGTIAANK